MSDPRITDEAVTAVALALADEVRKWPTDSYGPYDSRVGVGATFQELARVALGAALPHLVPVDRDALEEVMDREICTCQSCEEESGYNEGARAVRKAVLALLNGEVTS